jgi:hypothetical protein
MRRLITRQTSNEGEIFNKWLYSRLIRNNKNVLSAELGPTGSGKSYRDLRKAELWYRYNFKEQFPVENICFGLAMTMKRLASGELRRGEILVVEEAGVNLGSRDWQNKFSKMFNYVLQSFRSMNIGIFFNLPYLSMLDSQARHLLHYYAESSGIDPKKKLNKCKPFFLEVAQSSGKIYRHYPSVKMNGRSVKVKRFNYSMPSQYLIDDYEAKKEKYLKDLIKEYSEKANGKEKILRPPEIAEKCYLRYYVDGKSQQEIADEVGKTQKTISVYLKQVREWREGKKEEANKTPVEVSYIHTPLKTLPNVTSASQ